MAHGPQVGLDREVFGDRALRGINDLVAKGVLQWTEAGRYSTGYEVVAVDAKSV